MIKAIIFDAYGTLLSTGDGSVKAAKEILMLHNRMELSPEEFYADWKIQHRKHMDGLTSFITEEELFKKDLVYLYQKYKIAGDPLQDVQIMLRTLGCRKAFPETREVLERLSRHYVVAVGSTTDTAPLLRDMAENKMDVARVFTSQRLRIYKPQPEFYQRILHALDMNPMETLFVGDSLVDDVWGAQQIGMRACWINRKRKECGAFHPDYVISDLRELFEILEG